MIQELQAKLEKAKQELDKAYASGDWDFILDCSLDVYAIRRELEAIT